MGQPSSRTPSKALQGLIDSVLHLKHDFEEQGMKPRQVVIVGGPVPDGAVAEIAGLPVGWWHRIPERMCPRWREAQTWTIEMVGTDFAYGSSRLEFRVNLGLQETTAWEPKRRWLPDRVRDHVMSTLVRRFEERFGPERNVAASPPAAP